MAAPFLNGRRGHPVGFGAAYRKELLNLQGDTGARGLLVRDQARLVQIGTDHPGIFADIDTPENLQLCEDSMPEKARTLEHGHIQV